MSMLTPSPLGASSVPPDGPSNLGQNSDIPNQNVIWHEFRWNEPCLSDGEADGYLGTPRPKIYQCKWPGCNKQLAMTKENARIHVRREHIGEWKAYKCIGW